MEFARCIALLSLRLPRYDILFINLYKCLYQTILSMSDCCYVLVPKCGSNCVLTFIARRHLKRSSSPCVALAHR